MTGPGKPDAAPEVPVTPQQSMLALLERDDAPAKPESEKTETQEVEAEVSTEDVDSRETPEATEEPEIEPETEVDDVPEDEEGEYEAVYNLVSRVQERLGWGPLAAAEMPEWAEEGGSGT